MILWIILDLIIIGLFMCVFYIGGQWLLAIKSLEYTLKVFQSDDEEAKKRVIENFKNDILTVDLEA